MSDEPGYSRLVLPEGTEVPTADDDADLNARIDASDGVDAPLVDLRAGFAEGEEVRYWDFGAASTKAVPGFFLTRCNADGEPKGDGRLSEHPMLFDSVPGDRDYAPLRAVQAVCVTDKYDGELITSLSALDDAIDIGIVDEPGTASYWFNCPVVAKDVALDVASNEPVQPDDVFYRGTRAHCVDLSQQEGEFSVDVPPTVANVYELSRKGDPYGLRVVFSIAPTTDGARSKDYSPIWKLVKVTLASDANLEDYTQVSDFAAMDGNAVVPANDSVLSIKPSTNIVNRPLRFVGPL